MNGDGIKAAMPSFAMPVRDNDFFAIKKGNSEKD